MSDIKVDSITGLNGVSAPDFPSGIKLNGGTNTLLDYDEGTFTVSENTKVNLTGSGVFSAGSYIRVGNLVHCKLPDFTGYSITSAANTRTYLNLNVSGLPGAASDLTTVGGSAYASKTANDFGRATRMIGSAGIVFIEWIATDNETGGVIVSGYNFTYHIA